MARIAVFGGAGFIGSALIRRLLESDIESLRVIDNLTMGNGLTEVQSDARLAFCEADAADVALTGQFLSTDQFDVIYHLAANSDISKSAVDSAVDLHHTFGTTAALALELARNPRPNATLVFASTSAVYGAHDTAIEADTIKSPTSAYGWMKLASEKLLSSLVELGAIEKLVVVRFPNVTGSGQTHGVVKDLVAKYLSQETWTILGDGSQDKPYLHVDDLARILADLDSVFPAAGYHELNVAPDSSTKVSRIVEMIEARGGNNRKPVFGSSPQGWPGDVPTYTYDTSQLSRLGIQLPSSEDAIRKSIDEEFHRHGQ